MSHGIEESAGRRGLREAAQQKLRAGVAPPSRGWGVGVEALSLLHRLAGAPESAADALQLLHELQVHQVELDLQQAELESSERELAEDLARYRALYDWAPTACFVLDAQARIEESNRAGAELLAARAEDLVARPFDAFLSAETRPAFFDLLHALRADTAARHSCPVRLRNSPEASQGWQLTASTLPASSAVLLSVTAAAHLPAG
ncbi:MAG: PAS domain-containing protein [Xanthomonadales bacterium]|nr:PAS domain-containing protein [Xanthomonadales bacterium]